MHELSIVSVLAEKILGFLDEQKASKVLVVRVAVGELTLLEAEQMRFCYTAVSEGTPLQGSCLEIETVQAAVECAICRYQGRPKYWDDALAFAAVPTLECPGCGAAAEAVRGHECEIKSVQFFR